MVVATRYVVISTERSDKIFKLSYKTRRTTPMFAIKGYYNNGHIELAEPIPDSISSAELNIVVIPENTSNSEADFEAIGLNSFFETRDDYEIDWEKFFGLK